MSPSFDFDRVIDRHQTASLKWDRYRGRDVLPLWVADMDFPSPPAVIAALHRRVEHAIFGYTLVPDELVETIIAMLWARYGWEVRPEWLVWLPGLVTGLNVACRAVGAEGDEVLTTVPVYPPFLSAPGHFRRQVRTVPLRQAGDRWELDFEALAQAISGRTTLFLLCSPHNPTGRVLSRAELERLASLCLARDLVICSDEIHADLILDPDRHHMPTALLGPEVARRTITLMAPSKTYNIPGLGCSFAVIPDGNLRRAFRQAMEGIVPHVNLLGYTAAIAAYREGGEWLAALLAYLRGNRDRVAAAVGAMPGLAVNRVEATYLAWIDARGAGLADPAAFFEAAGVGLSDGRDFGGPGFVRLNFGCPRAVLDEALSRMARGLAAHTTP
ncbi:MAG: PatB family C-S lyase [Desulfobacteraceae bacterium]|nr:PatB family C-S lyase [Desulfobacteraceae bacterium]